MVPRLPLLDTGPVTGAPSLVAGLMPLQGLECREGIFLPSCFLFFQDGRGVEGPGPSRWVAVLPSALVPGEALCSAVDPPHCVLRLVLCSGLGAGKAGARCAWGVCLHVGGKPSCFLELPGAAPLQAFRHVVCACVL